MSDLDKKPPKVSFTPDNTGAKSSVNSTRRSENEPDFRSLVENLPVMFYAVEPQPPFAPIYVSPAFESLGFPLEEWLNNPDMWLRLIHPEDRRRVIEETEAAMRDMEEPSFEYRIIKKDGTIRWIRDCSRFVRDREGKPVCWQGIMLDITERRCAEDSLQRTVALLASTLESSNDGIVVINFEGEIVVYNKKFLEMWRIPPDVIEQKSVPVMMDYIRPQLKDPKKFEQQTAELYANPLATTLLTVKFKDGRIFERYTQPHFLEGEPVGRVCSFRDISERIRAEEKLLHYARHDSLTNLPNRAEFMKHLESAIERAVRDKEFRFAVLFLDLDRFKVINDSLGHVVGDKLLKAIADRLETCVRPRDVVARLGGDEFTILLNHSGENEDAIRAAERIQKALCEPFRIDGYEIFTSASIGVIISDEVARQPEDFLRDADTAMYRAKDAGKARLEVFDHAMHDRNLSHLRFENDLRKALERRELRVFYQPIANLETGEIEEFEALLRWQHPEYGLIAPNEFIGVAEETGLIVSIGKWILEEACRQITVWQNMFPRRKPLSVSVNLSAKQLMHPSLMLQVREILAKTGLKARYLNLEVKETTVMEHSETALSVLNDLNALGISLSSDDFGTGFSSLSYLQRFPFERLKIDRSFIGKMDSDAKSAEIVRTILMLAENLRLEAVAEGIETEEQLRQLQIWGCQFGQGYLLSKPVSLREAERLLAKGLEFKIPRGSFKNAFPNDLDSVLDLTEVQ